jgi:hypothetical protein
MCLERLIRSGRRALDPIKGESMKIGQSLGEHNSRGFIQCDALLGILPESS